MFLSPWGYPYWTYVHSLIAPKILYIAFSITSMKCKTSMPSNIYCSFSLICLQRNYDRCVRGIQVCHYLIISNIECLTKPSYLCENYRNGIKQIPEDKPNPFEENNWKAFENNIFLPWENLPLTYRCRKSWFFWERDFKKLWERWNE